MQRADAVGLFWEDLPPVSARGSSGPRPLPPIPETGWLLPTEFPSLDGQGAIAIDVESYDPDLKTMGPGFKRGAYICGVSIGTEAGFRKYYPIRHEMGPNLDGATVKAWLSRELKRPVPKIGANILYDLMALLSEGVKVVGPFYDVQIAEPLLDENKLSYSLDNLAIEWLGEGKPQNVMKDWLIDAFGPTNYKSNIWRAPASVVGPYAEGDVDLPIRIFELQRKEIETQGIWDLFVMESKLIPMLLAMWDRGVPVNQSRAQELNDKLRGRQLAAQNSLNEMSGFDVDIWSADSLSQVFDKFDTPYPLTEKTGKPSFRKDWLVKCAAPIAKPIMEIRRLDKFCGTFLEGALLGGSVNGLVHCAFHPLKSDEGGTVSGRFSSSGPNLQNIPNHDEELGPAIRSLFEAIDGKRWWKFDWSQIEFRLAIHHAARLQLRGAQQVVDKYHNDPTTDYHKIVAAITGLPRKSAKHINFGIIYGLGIEALAERLGVTVEIATKMYRDYMMRVPFVGKLRDRAMEHATKYGVITTLSGRNRHFDMWEKKGFYFNSYVKGAKRAFTHKALNARLQGDAADIMKTAMVSAWESGVFDILGAPALTVHDELDGDFDGSPQSIEALAEIKHIMETCVKLLVPLVADGGTGPNWGSIE